MKNADLELYTDYLLSTGTDKVARAISQEKRLVSQHGYCFRALGIAIS